MCVFILHLFQIISVTVWRGKFSGSKFKELSSSSSEYFWHVQGPILRAAGASQGCRPDPGLDPDLGVLPGPGEVQQVTLL